MYTPLHLLPAPRELQDSPGCYLLSDDWLIRLLGPNPQALRAIANRFKAALQRCFSFHWSVVASPATPASLVGMTLQVIPGAAFPAQGYRLTITPEEITIQAGDEAGAFYAVCTLVQIVEQAGQELPCLEIADWPDYPARGVMLDISRDKVPTMPTLLSLVDLLAGWKINQFQLYTEHTFAYRRYPEVWSKASPLTAEEILELDAYCRERYIELVPNQNSFGHMHRWLAHRSYRPIAEVEAGFEAPWGRVEGSFSLCPTDERSLLLVSSLFDELLPHFSSHKINVGCDETFDLGQGRSKAECDQKGAGRVYLDFLLKIYADLKARGVTMQFWGDIVLQHPELISELPHDIIALDWGYEADHPFDWEAGQFEEAGIPFYVCPGTSSWGSLAGRSDNALANLLSAAEHGRKHGAIGYLNTDWGDNGHWQVLPVSFLGYAAGAAYSWALEANRFLDIPQVLNRHAFHDEVEVMGFIAHRLGNIYQDCAIQWKYASVLSWILQEPLEKIRAKEKIRSIPFHGILEQLDEVDRRLALAQMVDFGNPVTDPGLIRKEYALTIRMLRHACWRGLHAIQSEGDTPAFEALPDLDCDLQELIQNYREIWLLRNRPGGLEDSAARLEKARQDYVRDRDRNRGVFPNQF